MVEMFKIEVVAPRNKKIRILVPQQLLEEFERMAKEEDLSEIITEALTEQVKRMRFRRDLEMVSSKVA